MRYYAHSGPSTDLDADGVLLTDHLRRVAGAAARSAAAAAPADEPLKGAAHAAGLLHDLGKYQPDWQAYLRADTRKKGTGRSVPHAVHGAAHAFQVGHMPISLAIAGHHGGLTVRSASPELAEQVPVGTPGVVTAVEAGGADGGPVYVVELEGAKAQTGRFRRTDLHDVLGQPPPG